MSFLSRIWPVRRQLDLAAPAVARDPFPHYEALRRAGPVHYLPRQGFWIILGHDEARQVFENPAAWSSAAFVGVDPVLLGADPPDHNPVRRLVSRSFSSDVLNRLAALGLAEAERRIRPELDLVAGYGLPISRAVTASLIGFDADAVAELAEATDSAETPDTALPVVRAILARLADRSALFETLLRESSGALSPEQAGSVIRLLWLAGTMTTERAITWSVLFLLRRPDLREALAADPALIQPFIEEVLRLHPPEHMFPRRAAAPARLGGIDIPFGALVQLCVSAANRDPAQFEAPAELRFDRPAKRHFAFGWGVHHCVGASLARRVVSVALQTLLAPGRELRLLRPRESIPMLATMTALTPKRLPVSIRSSAGS
jgi:cytochrome P450